MSPHRIILTLVALGVSISTTTSATPNTAYCEFYNEKACTGAPGACPSQEKCVSDHPIARNHCFVMWHFDRATNTTTVKQKGCFLEGRQCYDKTECIDSSNSRRKNVFFCCCSGDMCNRNFAWIPKSAEASSVAPPPPVSEAGVTPQLDLESQDRDESTIALSLSVPALTLIILGALYWCAKRRNSKKHPADAESNVDAAKLEPATLGPIQLLEIKARGNFGAVWKARMANGVVAAAKVFTAQHEQSWRAEREVFALPRMKHRDVLEFIGVERRDYGDDARTELWLITAYHERGSLCDFLRENVVTWPQLRRIGESVLAGLAHLHEEIPADKMAAGKPALAHRDFKSQNILLKADMTACIADFGLSLVFRSDEVVGVTHGQVGTRRYMAPEVLQGAINFSRDAFLRIDMYACALVLWELVSRCAPLGDDVPLPVENYELPFEAEVGLHPSLDDMLRIVVHRAERPRIMPSWRDHPGLRCLCETMEECWDADPEARPSASCALERVLGLAYLEDSTTAVWIEDNCLAVGAKEDGA